MFTRDLIPIYAMLATIIVLLSIRAPECNKQRTSTVIADSIGKLPLQGYYESIYSKKDTLP